MQKKWVKIVEPDMAYMLDPMSSGGRTLHVPAEDADRDKDFDPDAFYKLYRSLRDGSGPISPYKGYPEDVRLSRRRGKLPDTFCTSDARILVSKAVADIIRERDSGLHQFISAKFQFNDGTRWSEPRFEVINVFIRRDTVDPHSKCLRLGPPTHSKYAVDTLSEFPLLFTEKRADSPSIWREKKMGDALFASGELLLAMHTAGLRFFEPAIASSISEKVLSS